MRECLGQSEGWRGEIGKEKKKSGSATTIAQYKIVVNHQLRCSKSDAAFFFSHDKAVQNSKTPSNAGQFSLHRPNLKPGPDGSLVPSQNVVGYFSPAEERVTMGGTLGRHLKLRLKFCCHTWLLNVLQTCKEKKRKKEKKTNSLFFFLDICKLVFLFLLLIRIYTFLPSGFNLALFFFCFI